MSLNIVMAPSVAPIGSKLTIIENGEYNVKDYAVASVNVSGGGGETWNTVFEGSVTTEASGDEVRAIIRGYDLSADTIKVTFNGTEYTCEYNSATGYGAGYDDTTQETDWSEYPFNIFPRGGALIIETETAGTYTLKIEEPQSGGESDFSTANVTVVNNRNAESQLFIAHTYEVEGYNSCNTLVNVFANTSITVNVILYKGIADITIIENYSISSSGGVKYDSEYEYYYIDGNGTITIS